jgi:hypothetical protein
MKYFITQNVGSAKYVLSFHNGVNKHNDGSPFYDIQIFKNKAKLNLQVKALIKQGYTT